MKNSFKILFYIKRNSLLRNGLAPIMCRITVNGDRVQLSSQLSVDPLLWDVPSGRMKGQSAAARVLNEKLEQLRFRIEFTHYQLYRETFNVTPLAIKQKLLGIDGATTHLLAFFRSHNNEFALRVGISRSQSSLYKYRCVYRHLEKFIATSFKQTDLAFDRLDSNFVVSFHRYLLQTVGCMKNTGWVYMIAFKHILMLARSKGLLTHDLFANYKLQNEKLSRNYLTTEDLIKLIQCTLHTKTQRLIRDSFVFSCFTGLSYIDLRKLTLRNITQKGNHLWISTKRQKTGTAVAIRLLEIPSLILRHNMPDNEEDVIFALPVNSWCNLVLDKIAKQAGITEAITFHCARHTFATTMTLSQGVAIETISKLLGHRDIRTTQIYASITHDKLNRDLERLSKRIDPFYRQHLAGTYY